MVAHFYASHQSQIGVGGDEALTLELGADACDEGGEALAEALVHVDVGGRHAEQQL